MCTIENQDTRACPYADIAIDALQRQIDYFRQWHLKFTVQTNVRTSLHISCR